MKELCCYKKYCKNVLPVIKVKKKLIKKLKDDTASINKSVLLFTIPRNHNVIKSVG